MPDKIISTAQDFTKMLDDERELLVRRDGDSLVFVDHDFYTVALTRCDTLEKILSWNLHLMEKTWVTKEHLEDFTRMAMRENNLKRLPVP